MLFEWDSNKSQHNQRKHGVTFEEAQSVFADSNSLTIADPQHSDDEDRFIDIGYSAQGRMLVVVYTGRGERIRISSSRMASNGERKVYESKIR